MLNISEISIPSKPPKYFAFKATPRPRTLVFGHFDADGHLAAEQTRANLHRLGATVDVVVSTATRSYRFWESAFPDSRFRDYQLAVVVDIAFDFREPYRSLEVVLRTVDRNPNTYFVVIDHHTLPRERDLRTKLELVEVDSPFDCCLGSPSDDLMVLAAICDGEANSVHSKLSSTYLKRAIGVRRAAADADLKGRRLLGLLRNRRWDFFEALAEEPAECHLSARGYRRRSAFTSPLLESAKLAT